MNINTNMWKSITRAVLALGGVIFDITSFQDILESYNPAEAAEKAFEDGIIDELAFTAIQQWAESEQSKQVRLNDEWIFFDENDHF